MKILITGSSGYLGGCILLHLKKNKKFIITTCSSTLQENVIEKQIKIDWNDKNSIKQACFDQDLIIHCASPDSKECANRPLEAYRFNTINLELFITSAINCGVKKFIYFSSIHIYNTPLKGHLKESTPLKPKYPYGISKKLAEETILKFSKVDHFDISIIRLSNVFGKPCNKSINPWNLVVNDFCNQAVKTKKIIIKSKDNHTRNYVSINEIKNLVSFLIKKYSTNEVLPTILNFGGYWNMSLIELTQRISDLYFGWKNEKIMIYTNEGFNQKTEYFKFYLDNLYKTGYTPNTDYDQEIIKLFEEISKNE